MKSLQGAPVFAVEARSVGDYGPKAERELERNRSDYLAAGTHVVFDVDVLSPNVIRKYSASDPSHPVLFRRGEAADAEPAVPCQRISVDELFE